MPIMKNIHAQGKEETVLQMNVPLRADHIFGVSENHERVLPQLSGHKTYCGIR
jgi:hypothetical protein